MLGTGFINYGAYTGYPFRDEYQRRWQATDKAWDLSQRWTLPLDAVVDAMVEFSQYNGEQVYLRSFTLEEPLVTFALGSGSGTWPVTFPTADMPSEGYKTIAAFSRQGPHPWLDEYYDHPAEMEQLYVAFVVSPWLIAWIRAQAEGEYPFTFLFPDGGIPFYPVVCGEGVPRVRALSVYDTETVSIDDGSGGSIDTEVIVDRALQGDVTLVPGYNISIDENEGAYKISATPGAGSGVVPCSALDTVVSAQTAGNVLADATGDVILQGGDGCMRVRPAGGGTFVLENICTPCCTCDDYVDVINYIGTQVERIHTARKELDTARSRHTVMARTIPVALAEADSLFHAWCAVTRHAHTRGPWEEAPGNVETRYFLAMTLRVPYQSSFEINTASLTGADPTTYISDRSRVFLGTQNEIPGEGQTVFAGTTSTLAEIILCFDSNPFASGDTITVTVNGQASSITPEDLTA